MRFLNGFVISPVLTVVLDIGIARGFSHRNGSLI
jgi:hypothetical protein